MQNILFAGAERVQKELGDQPELKAEKPAAQLFLVMGEDQGAALTSWYLGDFRKQFVWTEIWPVQTFLQRSESEAA